MQTFHLPQVIADRQQQDRSYLEFLRVPSMSAGIYFLPADGTDPQRPHTEDEVYYIIKGRGSNERRASCLLCSGRVFVNQEGERNETRKKPQRHKGTKKGLFAPLHLYGFGRRNPCHCPDKTADGAQRFDYCRPRW